MPDPFHHKLPHMVGLQDIEGTNFLPERVDVDDTFNVRASDAKATEWRVLRCGRDISML